MTKEEADKLVAQGVSVVEDSGRGYRKVVASPMPIKNLRARNYQNTC